MTKYDTRFCPRCNNFCIIVLDNFIISFKDFHLVTRINKSSECNHETDNKKDSCLGANDKGITTVFVIIVDKKRNWRKILQEIEKKKPFRVLKSIYTNQCC